MVMFNLIDKFLNRMNTRQDDKSTSSCRDGSNWKYDVISSHHDKISPNSNNQVKNAFFTEDTFGNDFFYDEEFTVPFDANLMERRGSENSTNQIPHHHHHGIVASKSDNCIYQADLDFSESDKEPSGSEQEVSSSSDSSELFNQPLFSSHSECPDEFNVDGSCDQDSVIEESPPKNVQGHGNIKHHYKISFDRGPQKIWSSSDEPASKTFFETRILGKPLNSPDSKCSVNKPSHTSFASLTVKNDTNNSGVVSRKSKKKSTSHKESTSRASKSYQPVTWGIIRGVDSATKSRTTWKEIKSKPEELEAPKSNRENKHTAKSCHELTLKHDTVAKSISKDVKKNDGNLSSATSKVDKTCELFKIFQDKKLKEIEEIMDTDMQDVMDNFNDLDHYDGEAVLDCEGTTDAALPPDFPVLQEIFHNSSSSVKKSKPDGQRLKPKYKSLDRSSPTRDVDGGAPKTTNHSATAAATSTNSIDSSVQTSLVINIPVRTENKSLQTSFVDEKQDSTGRDIWSSSSYLFSRPLPDLSFLKNSAKFMEARIETSLTKPQKSSSKDDFKLTKKFNSQTSHSKSTLKHSPKQGSKNSISSRTSQDFSARSKSSSSFSFHSSSSSGIDPGTSDSGRQSSSASSKDESLHSDGKESFKTPLKPPRSFRSPSAVNSSSLGAESEGCSMTGDRLTKSNDVSNEPSVKPANAEPKNSKNLSRSSSQIRKLSVGQEKFDSVAGPASSNNATNGTKVVLRSAQPGYTRPTKSILVRNRRQENRRSWSNNQSPSLNETTATTMRQSSPKKRPLSVPDGTLLELKIPSQEEDSDKTPVAEPEEKTFPETQPPPDDVTAEPKLPSGENPGSGAVAQPPPAPPPPPSDQDYEKFRAKKSVSFSETISYHPTTSSLSPLESPKSPVSSMPTSPDVENAQDDSKCCRNAAQDMAEDVELPPNDFLVSPNLSPSSSSLSDSSGNLQPLSFDLQQKKDNSLFEPSWVFLKTDLVLDVMKAVEVILKYVNRCRDPLAKVKLCSTVDNPLIGNLLLEHLCPSIHAIILDGIKLTVPGLFGRVKSSACKVFEDSLEGSPFDSLQHLMRSMRDLKFLNNQWVKFNAYIFALLNLKVLDMWLATLRKNKLLLSRYYSPTSFLQLSSNSTNLNCQALFFDVITSLQPLSQIQFRLEYDFEVNVVERRRQAFIAEQLLNKHVSHSAETHTEAEYYLSRMCNNALSFDSSAAHKIPDARHPASSLCFDNRACDSGRESENMMMDENSESSISLFWSSVDFGGFAKGFLQRTQNRLMEKLSQSKDIFSFDGTSSFGKVVKHLSTAQENETQQAQCHQPSYSYESFGDAGNVSAPMSRSDCPKSYLSAAKQSPSSSKTKTMTDVRVGSCDVASPTENNNSNKVTNQNQAGTRQMSDNQTKLVRSPNFVLKNNGFASNAKPSSVSASPSTLRKDMSATSTSSSSSSYSSPAATPRVQTSLLGFYGTKLVDVFDKLLLSSQKTEEKSPFVIRKQFYSEDQISKYLLSSQSPSAGIPQTTNSPKQLAKSMSTENGRTLDVAGNQRSILFQSNLNKFKCAKSLCHYVAMDNQFLSFEKDEELKVVKEVGHDFFLCRLGDREGLVYKVCVSIA